MPLFIATAWLGKDLIKSVMSAFPKSVAAVDGLVGMHDSSCYDAKGTMVRWWIRDNAIEEGRGTHLPWLLECLLCEAPSAKFLRVLLLAYRQLKRECAAIALVCYLLWATRRCLEVSPLCDEATPNLFDHLFALCRSCKARCMYMTSLAIKRLLISLHRLVGRRRWEPRWMHNKRWVVSCVATM